MVRNLPQAPPPNLLFPGLVATILVATARFLGVLQFLELKVLDDFLRLRAAEPRDERISIVEVTDADIAEVGTYPIPDSVIVDTLRQVQQYQPQAIGLDIFRDFPQPDVSLESGQVDIGDYQELIDIVRYNPNIFVVDKIVPPTVSAPVGIPLEQVGFVDTMLDNDGFVRRSLLGIPDVEGQFRMSFTILLAQKYLESAGISLSNGERDPVAMQFGEVELSSAHSDSPAYVNQDTGGNPIVLINFRSGRTPFRKVSLSNLLSGQVSADWFRDRLVLIGITAESVKDTVNSDAVFAANPGLVPGVEVQAHAISQLLSAVLDDRPLLKTWPLLWQYLWIVAWGIAGIGLSRVINAPWLHLTVVILSTAGIFFLGYLLLIVGWWIPVFPAGMLYFFNGAILYGFYWYEQSIRLRLQERQLTIEESFSAIHNGPMQTLNATLKAVQSDEWSRETILKNLQCLNQELRGISEIMEERGGMIAPEQPIYSTGNFVVDLGEPLHELLYQVYSHTLDRELANFSDIQVHMTQFEPMVDSTLSLEHKREITCFFEEALCNVGKYAENATRLEITCKQKEIHNIIRVVDNGVGLEAAAVGNGGGSGTKQAERIAKKLSGTFSRRNNQPRGTICELLWPVKQSPRWYPWT